VCDLMDQVADEVLERKLVAMDSFLTTLVTEVAVEICPTVGAQF